MIPDIRKISDDFFPLEKWTKPKLHEEKKKKKRKKRGDFMLILLQSFTLLLCRNGSLMKWRRPLSRTKREKETNGKPHSRLLFLLPIREYAKFVETTTTRPSN